MIPIPSVLFVALVVLPLFLLGSLFVRTHPYRRPTSSPFAWSFIRPLRPDQLWTMGRISCGGSGWS